MCSGRIAGNGQLVIVTVADASTKAGRVFYVVNPEVLALTPERGRPATPRERQEARAPYESPRSTRWEKPAEIPDDLLDEKQALRAARLEQQRTPPDLVNIAA